MGRTPIAQPQECVLDFATGSANIDYVTRRKLEERLFKEQSERQKAEERKYESNRGEDIIDHLSKDWKLISSSGDIRICEGRKAMADDIARPSR